jgi:NTP pyrophosphatase (non-canonical NTP hydrolase)
MEHYQKELDKWFKDNNWPYWTPHEILARLMEETGEFARLVNHLHGPKKKKASEAEQDLEEEMGDILYTLICYANSNGINLDNAIRKSFDKSVTRDKDRFK